MRAISLLAAAACLSACIPNDAPGNAGASPGAAATLRSADGRDMARARATVIGDGLRVTLTAAGLAPGTYGAHVHMMGRCDAPGFESAGGHWNPTMRQHGRDNPQGPHRGDLPNLVVGANGRGEISFTVANASLAGGVGGMMDEDGAAIIVHAQPDDYRTDPSGNSGARIACGVFS